jgi:hypothetical protein
MKIIKLYILLFLSGLTLFSCKKLEETRYYYKGQPQIEFDATGFNAVLTGRTYPMLTRVPGYGRPVIATANAATGVVADPLLTRTSGTVKFRVNLMTAPMPTDQVISYRVVATEKDASGADVTVTTAVSGTHYTTGNTFVIPANSSFGEVTVQILDPGPTAGATRDLVLELLGNSEITASASLRKLGLRIAQN